MDGLTARDRSTFNAGIEAARQMALTAAVTLEVRDDARQVRQQAAVAALQGLAAGLHAAFIAPLAETGPMHRVMAAIAADPAGSGAVECLDCKGWLAWARDSSNGHLHAQCETEGCLKLMQ
ncbi:hypothetical protein [Methylobacterium pseudosasicola]|uniref:Uncharacterized protein n=1 Tax=Methylobacterium pseudosasicola TaxID=582667 RepID=A0A1I4UP43_9HYPH|nr:hypothetical protein [Methylobacterium pseudosasicola]SFM90777.1 hypothetical protein SAMN05192568_10749 [Methylobacterium pseudosasicola]